MTNLHPCDGCGMPTVVVVNWQSSLHGGNFGDPRYPRHLRPVRAMRSGWIHECDACRGSWFLDAAQEWLWPILPERAALVERWNDAPLVPTPAQFHTLARIGAPPRLGDGALIHYVEVPCRVTTPQGEVIDPAVVRFQDHPPVETWPAKLKLDLFDRVASIEASRFALSRRVRYATTQAVDVAGGHMMMRSGAQTPDGRRAFALADLVNVVKMDGVKAGDLVPMPNFREARPGAPRLEEIAQPVALITYFIADWSTDAEALRFGADDA